MADKKDEVELPATGGPAAEIPDLKKKEKEEKKKSGAAWGQAGKPAGSFSGATGAAAARAAASAARIAVGQAGGGGFVAWLLGSKALLAAIAAAVMAAGIMAAKIVGGGASGASGKAGSASAGLGDISSTIKVKHEADSSGLGFLQGAGRGTMKFEEAAAKKEAPKTAPAPAAGKSDAAQPGDQLDHNSGVTPGQDMSTRHLDRTQGMAKLSDSLGSQFGGKDVFQTGPKIGSGFQSKGLGGFKGGANVASRGGGLQRTGLRGALGTFGLRGGQGMSHALRQLRAAGTQSQNVNRATTNDAASSQATAQFEGAQAPAAAPTAPTDTAPAPTSSNGGGGGGQGTSPGNFNPNLNDISEVCTIDQMNQGMIAAGGSCVHHQLVTFQEETPWKDDLTAASWILMTGAAVLTVTSAISILAKGLMASVCTAAAGGALQAIVAIIAAIIAALAGIISIILSEVARSKGADDTTCTMLDVGSGALILAACLSMIGGGFGAAAAIVGGMLGAGMAVSGIMNKPPPQTPQEQCTDSNGAVVDCSTGAASTDPKGTPYNPTGSGTSTPSTTSTTPTYQGPQ